MSFIFFWWWMITFNPLSFAFIFFDDGCFVQSIKFWYLSFCVCISMWVYICWLSTSNQFVLDLLACLCDKAKLWHTCCIWLFWLCPWHKLPHWLVPCCLRFRNLCIHFWSQLWFVMLAIYLLMRCGCGKQHPPQVRYCHGLNHTGWTRLWFIYFKI